MKHFVSLGLVLLLGAASLAADKPAVDIPELIPKPTNEIVIKLRHVKPSLMVQWIDPKNHPAPIEDCGPKSSAVSLFQIPAGIDKVKVIEFQIPAGIDKVEAIEDQNCLLVCGTKEAVKELKQLVDLLDVPLKELELDVALYKVDADTLNTLNPRSVSASPIALSRPSSAIVVTEREKKILDEAIATGRAQMLKKEKLRTLNNRAVCMESQLPNSIATLITTFKISLVPTVNGDGTITVLAQPGLNTSQTVENQTVPTTSSKIVQMVFNARDGDTVMLSLSPWKVNPQNYVCVITPRLVRKKTTPQK